MLRKRGGFRKKPTGKTVLVSGPISKIHQPDHLDNFNGYAIVVINGNVVKGYFPFLDLNFTYSFNCYLVNTYRGPEHEIESPGTPPFAPLPLTRERLRLMLRKTLNMPDNTAADVIASLERDPRLSDLDFDNMDPQKLLTNLAPTPDWLERMAQNSIYFRYPFVKILHRFWDPSELSGFNIPTLLKISADFEAHPESFAYHWLHDYGLPELSYEKVQLAYRLLNKEEPRNLLPRMAIYGNCRVQAERFGRPCIGREQLDEWGLRIEPAVAAKIIRPDGWKESNGLYTMCYFTMPYYLDLQIVVAGLARLNSKVLSPNLFLKKPRNIGLPYNQLNAQQQFLLDGSKQYGFMIWDACAGTGKTTTALSAAAHSSSRAVMPVAYFGRVASNLRKTWKTGITIHRLWHLIKNKTEQGERYEKYVRRVFIDEGSHLTLELLAMVFKACPKLEQLIFMGDAGQMRPPSGVPIYEALIAFYADTPIVQTLTEVMRVDRTNADSASQLIENGRKLRAGRSDLVFSRVLLAENPFVILPRIEIPGELYVIEPDKPATRQKRVEIMKQTLRPVLAYLQSFQDYQMLALRHDTIGDMNMAISQIYEESPANGLRQERIYKVGSKIMFSQTFYPQKELKMPKKDPAKRRQMAASYAWRTRTTQVNNNEICTITQIVDVDPDTEQEFPVSDTGMPRVQPSYLRILRLDTGGQVNLALVPLSKIYRGDVSTISSAQGSEWGIAYLYMDERDCRADSGRPPLAKSDTLYTVFTRAKRQVIISCRATYDDLSDSDIGVVAAAKRPPPDLTLHHWLPPYQGQIQQSAATSDPEATDASENEESDDEDEEDEAVA